MKKLFIFALALIIGSAVFAQSNTTDVQNKSDAVNSGVGLALDTGNNKSSAWNLLFPNNMPGNVAIGGCMTAGVESAGGAFNFLYGSRPVQLWSKQCAFPAELAILVNSCQYLSAKLYMDGYYKEHYKIDAAIGFKPTTEHATYANYLQAKFSNLSFEDCLIQKQPTAAGPKPAVAASAPAPAPIVVPAPVAASAPAPQIVIKREREIVHTRDISLDSMTLFDTAKYDVTSKGKQAISEAMAKFNPKNVIVLEVSGRTDDVGTIEYNRELSLKRAASVAVELRSLGFIVTSVVGYGKEKPIAPGTTPGARAMNRSVTITVQESSSTVVTLGEEVAP
jgi:outer membrane protein OmpA-like peptidoglycan-associated protein